MKIRDSAFIDYEGVIIHERGSERLVVRVTMIGQSVAVDLGREAVAPV